MKRARSSTATRSWALIGASWARQGRLKGGGVVATVMSNLGLERFLEGEGLRLERTKVGDRYVLERMKEGGFNVGGEQSGHMILSDYATTGDGTLAGLQVLAELVASGKPASELLHQFDPVPQLLKNVRFAGGAPLDDTQGSGGDRRGRGDAGRARAARHPSVGHRTADPRDGRRRRCRTGRARRRHDLRRGARGDSIIH